LPVRTACGKRVGLACLSVAAGGVGLLACQYDCGRGGFIPITRRLAGCLRTLAWGPAAGGEPPTPGTLVVQKAHTWAAVSPHKNPFSYHDFPRDARGRLQNVPSVQFANTPRVITDPARIRSQESHVKETSWSPAEMTVAFRFTVEHVGRCTVVIIGCQYICGRGWVYFGFWRRYLP